MEQKMMEGRCPKCGKALQIPEGLKEFSCLYCGARLDPTMLLPLQAIELPEELIALVNERMPACVEDAAQLRLHARLAMLPAADDPRAFLRIQIGIFKQTAAEGIYQQPGGASAEAALHGFLSVLLTAKPVGFQNGKHIVVAAELIHTVFQDPQMALGFA